MTMMDEYYARLMSHGVMGQHPKNVSPTLLQYEPTPIEQWQAAPWMWQRPPEEIREGLLGIAGSTTPATLSMAKAARMARAAKMGFKTKAYHGTTGNVRAFSPKFLGETTAAPSAQKAFFFTKSPRVAESYAELANDRVIASLTRAQSAAESRARALVRSRSAKNPKAPPSKAELKAWDKVDRLTEKIEAVTAKKQGEYESASVAYDAARKDLYAFLNQPKVREFTSRQGLMDPAVSEIDSIRLMGPPSWAKTVDSLLGRLSKAKQNLRSSQYPEGGNIMPVRLKMNRPLVHDFKGKEYRDVTYNNLIKKAQREGYDSVIMKNTSDPGLSYGDEITDIYAVLNPNQIRSTFARFDPKQAHSPDLMAGFLPIGGLMDKRDRR